MNGHKRPLRERHRMREDWWQRRRARARSEAARAHLQWDEVRARINDMPPESQDEAWRAVGALLGRWVVNLTPAPAGRAWPNAQTRARAREAQPNTGRKEESR